MADEDLGFDAAGARPGVVTELFRKALVSGVGALFMTEEGIRSMVKELKLPKEAIAAVIAQADRTKGEVARVIGGEVRAFLRSTALRDELLELLTQLRLEVRAEVGIKRRDEPGGVLEPAVRTRVEVSAEKRRRAPARKGKGRKKAPA